MVSSRKVYAGMHKAFTVNSGDEMFKNTTGVNEPAHDRSPILPENKRRDNLKSMK